MFRDEYGRLDGAVFMDMCELVGLDSQTTMWFIRCLNEVEAIQQKAMSNKLKQDMDKVANKHKKAV